MSVILDAGAWIALDRNDRAMWRRLKAAQLAGDVPRSQGASSDMSGAVAVLDTRSSRGHWWVWMSVRSTTQSHDRPH